jgi:hypothetical protein
MPIILLQEPEPDDEAGWARWLAEGEEFELIYETFKQAFLDWIDLTGCDPHVGADGKRYGRDEDGNFIDGPHFDPEFLEYLREQGRIESMLLDRDDHS